jgi:hypothetical protein
MGQTFDQNLFESHCSRTKIFTLDKRDESGAIIYDSESDEPLKETFIIPDYYPALMSEVDYLTLSKLDRHRAVTRSSSTYPGGNPEPEIPLLSGIGILFAENVDLSCSNLVQVKTSTDIYVVQKSFRVNLAVKKGLRHTNLSTLFCN